ncbi:aminotransferase class I/II-fold pyridoxal phosphate-dependent enzyme [Staphylococcus felis]|uniref:aminotransferase class I/II-fold pyridoxal phosphate-dependent enzyme n=1 Tax=Staphylococcus felis TaxID=46127 RepID=UPI000E247742|nr:aminotransferase class I/II-fold pyridoxal phosphate-dependent enzyme [Staphylococcus felis]REH76003.1 8-amino-7-oxononanoate synthase [Staphylococcus felis]
MNLEQTLTDLKEKGLYRQLINIESISGKWLTIEGQRYINFTSNDYLGLGQLDFDPQDYARFLNQYGHHLSSSRLISGNSSVYHSLESRISQWLGFEACILLNSGYDANLAVFNSLKDQNILVFSDQKNHASLIDGIKLSSIEKVIFKHLDYDELEEHLALYQCVDMPKVIVSDSIFSTDGSITNLQRLIELKKRYDAWLIIDDSHGLGLHTLEHYTEIDIVTSSLSKAWGAHGGAILCSHTVKELIINKGRSLIYTSGLPTYQLYFIQHRFEYIQHADTRRKKLFGLSDYFNRQLQIYFPNQSISMSPIKNIVFESLHDAEHIYRRLYNQKLFVSYLRYPTVQNPTLRISLSYFHDKDDIDTLFKAMIDTMKEVKYV